MTRLPTAAVTTDNGHRRTPTLSVVIPTYNRLERLERVLHGLRHQTADPAVFEVIVVSDGSTDGTTAWLRGRQAPLPVTAAVQDNQGPAAARNHGVALARGTVVLFLDDDVVPRPDLVQAHLDAHAAEGGDTVVIGPMLTPSGFRMSPWVRYEQAMLGKQYDAMARRLWEPTARQFFTGNASLERRHLLAAGGFDPAFGRAEDVELAYRLADRGLRFVFVPDACGDHYAVRAYRSWRATAYTYGRTDVVFARDKRHDWLLWAIDAEYHRHHPLLRLVVDRCLDQPWLFGPMARVFSCLAMAAAGVRAERIVMAALSAVYNADYYRGVVDEAGPPARPGRLSATVNPAGEPRCAAADHPDTSGSRDRSDDKGERPCVCS